MANTSPRRSAIVADRRPLERGLARFLLEEEGVFVAGEASTMADVLLQIQEFEPDLLVVHEKLLVGSDPSVVGQVRAISPRTKIVLLAASAQTLPAELVLMADTVVEDGPGLTQLGRAVAGPAAREEAEQQEAIAAADPVAAGTSRRWFDRIQGLGIASVIVLAFLFARSVAMNAALSDEARGHLNAASDSVDQLRLTLATAPPDEIARIASKYLIERVQARQAGADIRELDQALIDQVNAAWPLLSDEVRTVLMGILGTVYAQNGEPPPGGPAPAPTGTTSSPPPVGTTESPPPSPSQSPSETQTTSPTQSVTTTDSPTTDTPTTEPPTTTTEPPTTTTEPPTTTTEPPTTTTDTWTTTKTLTTTDTTTETLTTTTTDPTTTDPTTTDPTTTDATTTEATTTEATTTTETSTPSETPTSAEPLTTEKISAPNAVVSKMSKTSDDILVIPPAIVIFLLTGMGIARRRAVRDDEPPSDAAS